MFVCAPSDLGKHLSKRSVFVPTAPAHPTDMAFVCGGCTPSDLHEHSVVCGLASRAHTKSLRAEGAHKPHTTGYLCRSEVCGGRTQRLKGRSRTRFVCGFPFPLGGRTQQTHTGKEE